MLNALFGLFVLAFALLMVDTIVLSETVETDGFIEKVHYRYSGESTLDDEAAFKASTQWFLQAYVVNEEGTKKYDCDISKDNYLATAKLLDLLAKTGPLPSKLGLSSGTIFPGTSCKYASFIKPSDYLQKISGYAVIKSFHYYGNDEALATKFDVKVAFRNLTEKTTITMFCPIDKVAYQNLKIDAKVMPDVYKNPYGKGDESYFCEKLSANL